MRQWNSPQSHGYRQTCGWVQAMPVESADGGAGYTAGRESTSAPSRTGWSNLAGEFDDGMRRSPTPNRLLHRSSGGWWSRMRRAGSRIGYWRRFRPGRCGGDARILSRYRLARKGEAFAGGLIVGIDYLRERSCPVGAVRPLRGPHWLFRGDRLCLVQSRWWDDSGNTAANLHVGELDEDGRLSRLLYFDGDDFASAYQELDARYYAGEVQHTRTRGTQSAFVAAVDSWMPRQPVSCADQNSGGCRRPGIGRPVRTIGEVIFWFRDRADGLTPCELDFCDHVDVAGRGHQYRGGAWNQPRRCRTTPGQDYIATFPRRAVRIDTRIRARRRGNSRSYMRSRWSNSEVAIGRNNAAGRWRGVRRVDSEGCQCRGQSVFGDRLRRQASTAGALESGVDYLNNLFPALLSQYDRFGRTRVLAVRGDRLCLRGQVVIDESGNEATNLHLDRTRR